MSNIEEYKNKFNEIEELFQGLDSLLNSIDDEDKISLINDLYQDKIIQLLNRKIEIKNIFIAQEADKNKETEFLILINKLRTCSQIK